MAAATNFKIMIDAPSDVPVLGFREYAEALGGVARHSDARFAIGIFGSWGSGKTTLMDAIDQSLQRGDDAMIVRFSAWRYEREEHLIIPLLDHIGAAAAAWEAAQRPGQTKARKLANKLQHITAALLQGFSLRFGLPGAVELSFEANKAALGLAADSGSAGIPRSFYFAAFEAMQRAFAEFADGHQRRIVVFIDDLDRCLPDTALELLESMKLFFDLPGFVFVVGVDRVVVERLVEHRYRELRGNDGRPEGIISGADYIEKMFQVPFVLPTVPSAGVAALLENMCTQNCIDGPQRREILGVVAAHAGYLIDVDGINPRELKRYVNEYIMHRKVNGNHRPNAILTLNTIRYRRDWNQIESGLLTFRHDFLAAVKRYVNGERAALAPFGADFDDVPPLFAQYVRSGPGQYFIGISPQELDSHIAAGATHTTSDQSAARELFRMVGDVYRMLTPDTISEARSGIGSLQAQLTKLSTLAPLQNCLGTVEDLDRLLAQQPSSSLDEAERLSRAQELLRELLRELRDAFNSPRFRLSDALDARDHHWRQRGSGNRLNREICAWTISLAVAQQRIAQDWTTVQREEVRNLPARVPPPALHSQAESRWLFASPLTRTRRAD